MASEERLLSTKSTNIGSTWRDFAQARLNIGSGEAQLGAKMGQHGPKMDHLAADGAQEGPNFAQHGPRWSLRGPRMLATGKQNCEVCVGFVDFWHHVAKHCFPYSFCMVRDTQQRPR